MDNSIERDKNIAHHPITQFKASSDGFIDTPKVIFT